MELGALWSSERGPERKHAAETRQEQLCQLRYSDTSIYTLIVLSLIGVMFSVDDHCSVCVCCRRPLVEWSAGPSSFPASLKAPPPPTQAVITPPTPQVDPMVWEESAATPPTPTTAQAAAVRTVFCLRLWLRGRKQLDCWTAGRRPVLRCPVLYRHHCPPRRTSA